MASHNFQRPADTGTDDPRVVSLLTGREWIGPTYEPLDLIDLRVRQLRWEREQKRDRLYVLIEWLCVGLCIAVSIYFSWQFMR